MDITDKELLRIAMTGVRAEMSRTLKLGRTIELNRFVDMALKSMRRWYKAKYRPEKTPIETRKMEEFINSKRQMVQKGVEDAALSCNKSQKLSAINAATAKCIISSLLDEHGITGYRLVSQKYRIKVYLPLSFDKFLILPIKYKDIYNGAEKILPAYEHVREIVSSFGKDVCIR